MTDALEEDGVITQVICQEIVRGNGGIELIQTL